MFIINGKEYDNNPLDTKDKIVTFDDNKNRENINSGDKHSTIMGKIKKYFTDLKAIAFSGSYNDLTDTPHIPTKPEDIRAVPWYYDNGVDANEDWNDFINPGSYKVQGASMDEEHHAPVGLYNYGILIVILSENPDAQNEHRLVQFYIPHAYSYEDVNSNERGSIACRMCNGGTWGIWYGYWSAVYMNENFLRLTGGTITGSVFLNGTGKGLYALTSDGSMGLGLVADIHNVRGLYDKSINHWVLFIDYLNNLRLTAPKQISLEALNTTSQNTGVAVLSGNGGVYEWVVAAEIHVNGIYLNHTLKIEIGGRGRALTAELFVLFESIDNTDPGLAGFWYYGAPDTPNWIRIKKTAAHVWQIIALKNESYGDIFVANVNSQYQLINPEALNITYPGTGIPTDSVDSSWMAPYIAGAVKNADFLTNIGINSMKYGALCYKRTLSATSWPSYEIMMIEDSDKYARIVFGMDGSGNVNARLIVQDVINTVKHNKDGYLVTANIPTNAIYTIYKRLRVSKFLAIGVLTEGLVLETNSITVDVSKKLSICPESGGMVLIGNQNYGSMTDTKNFTDYDVAKPNILLSHGTNKDDWVGMGVNQYKTLNIRTGGSSSEQMVYVFGRHVAGVKSYGLQITDENDKYFIIGPYGNYGCRISCFELSVMDFVDGYTPIKAKAFNVQSSARYKENIRDLLEEDVKKIIRNLRPVIFDYKNHDQGINCYGLIAEEVDKTYQFAVSYNADGDPDSVDYSKLTTPLLKMVQINDAELEETKNELVKANKRITELEQKNKELEERLAKLETLLLK